jgi:hypothetical protein
MVMLLTAGCSATDSALPSTTTSSSEPPTAPRDLGAGPATETIAPFEHATTRAGVSTIGPSPTRVESRSVFSPPLPIDLATDTGHDADAHDHSVHDDATGDAGGLGGDAAISANFVVAVYTHRFDDPAYTRLRRLTPLVVDPNTTVASVPTLHDGDIATWPIITAVTDSGNGWWRVQATLKTTRHDQHGPTSQPLVVEVHITGELVEAWHIR